MGMPIIKPIILRHISPPKTTNKSPRVLRKALTLRATITSERVITTTRGNMMGLRFNSCDMGLIITETKN